MTQTSPRALRNFVDGEYREASSDTRTDIVNPATGEVVATAPVSGRADVTTLSLRDQLGFALTGDHHFLRFNPAAGISTVKASTILVSETS